MNAKIKCSNCDTNLPPEFTRCPVYRQLARMIAITNQHFGSGSAGRVSLWELATLSVLMAVLLSAGCGQ
ncbi:MAG: hypothetical protein ACLP9L_23810, partial [Thermoguttaceae bacterium]